LLRESADSLTGLIEVESERGRWLYFAGRYREARSFLEGTLSRASDPELAGDYWANAGTALCEVLFALGEWDAEQPQLEQVQQIALRPGSAGEDVVPLARTAGELAISRGDTDTANRWVEIARANLPTDEEKAQMEIRMPPRFLAAQIAVHGNDLVTARDELAPVWHAKGYERVPDMWRPLMLAAHIEADLAASATTPTGPSPDEVAVIREVAARLPRYGDVGVAWTTHVDAELARAMAHDDPAVWSKVVEAWRTVGHVPYLASSLTRQAAAHLAAGDRDASTGPLTEAFRIASDLGAQPLRDRIVELARRGHLRLGDGADSQPIESGQIARLTNREVEVLRLLAQGMSNSEIAQKLFISPKTASVHVSRILTKLGVNSRAKAAAIAYEESLLTDASSRTTAGCADHSEQPAQRREQGAPSTSKEPASTTPNDTPHGSRTTGRL
jgi:DNA-binding CsgD family transcriptional regulator